jgi:hypothetical protein
MDITMDRQELIAELQRLENYCFYVIEEAYELAARMDLTLVSDMPVSTAALVFSQKPIEIKFDQRSPVLVGS